MDAAPTLADLVPDAESITVPTGAGISTDSGIPDFRGPQGVWTKDPSAEAMSTIGSYLADPAVRRRAWRTRRDHPGWGAEPNAAHAALVEIERSGRLRRLITQNIDGLHQRAGSDPALVLEIHGTPGCAGRRSSTAPGWSSSTPSRPPTTGSPTSCCASRSAGRCPGRPRSCPVRAGDPLAGRDTRPLPLGSVS